MSYVLAFLCPAGLMPYDGELVNLASLAPGTVPFMNQAADEITVLVGPLDQGAKYSCHAA